MIIKSIKIRILGLKINLKKEKDLKVFLLKNIRNDNLLNIILAEIKFNEKR